jgi:hypothetical protein
MIVAIPSVSSYYFTAGKEYPVIRTEGYQGCQYVILCNKGHERVISKEDGARSAHLPPMGYYRYGFPSDMLGTFRIVEK